LVQTPNVLDAVYADNAVTEDLGAIYESATSTVFSVWAPTAQAVSLELTTTGTTTHAMTEDAATGIWSVTINDDLKNAYYRFDLDVYHHETDDIELLQVTDPYSLSLSTNSELSQVVDLSDASLLPADWATSDVAITYAPEDITVYESHIRDFSVNDELGSASLNGKYGAFTESARESVQHLLALRTAGLTHLHLLPAFDIATINEVESERVELNDLMSDLCAANASVAADYPTECASGETIAQVMAAMDETTGEVQALNGILRNLDGFNWGYDPFHYTVPEGSYSTDPEGTARILEFREMVKALHDEDLMVVMDVVYNHTNASGLSSKSVLDKVVPGYYHRRNLTSGAVETSTCCANTASEHRMFEKLMIDSLVVWAQDYKIDAFRFDLMGHHMKENMVNALAAVQAVRPHVYFYGEGWDFGEVGQGQRGDNASQTNMAGTGIGTFTDRLRDAVRGGGPFDDGDAIRMNQGFGNAPIANELNTVPADFEAALLEDMDIVRVGLAGNLKTFTFTDRTGEVIDGTELDYNGSPTAYVDDPQEIVNYVSKHDNQTLWDNNMYKMPSSLTSAQRARLQALSLSIPLMSQGVPFIHMGSELLRSKSMSRDSYDSGDWFNAVHFDGTGNNWNVGLPRENVDGANWELIGEIIADVNSAPTTADIALTEAQFKDSLAIRYSSDLFRLNTADQVNDVVSFHNTGVSQTPGVIVMKLTDTVADIDASYDEVVVIFNATLNSETMTVTGASGYSLHPVLAASSDTVVQGASVTGASFTVPALTTAVFVK
jgi:pullulanase-type alpha-1,6-glucosidase